MVFTDTIAYRTALLVLNIITHQWLKTALMCLWIIRNCCMNRQTLERCINYNKLHLNTIGTWGMPFVVCSQENHWLLKAIRCGGWKMHILLQLVCCTILRSSATALSQTAGLHSMKQVLMATCVCSIQQITLKCFMKFVTVLDNVSLQQFSSHSCHSQCLEPRWTGQRRWHCLFRGHIRIHTSGRGHRLLQAVDPQSSYQLNK